MPPCPAIMRVTVLVPRSRSAPTQPPPRAAAAAAAVMCSGASTSSSSSSSSGSKGGDALSPPSTPSTPTAVPLSFLMLAQSSGSSSSNLDSNLEGSSSDRGWDSRTPCSSGSGGAGGSHHNDSSVERSEESCNSGVPPTETSRDCTRIATCIPVPTAASAADNAAAAAARSALPRSVLDQDPTSNARESECVSVASAPAAATSVQGNPYSLFADSATPLEAALAAAAAAVPEAPAAAAATTGGTKSQPVDLYAGLQACRPAAAAAAGSRHSALAVVMSAPPPPAGVELTPPVPALALNLDLPSAKYQQPLADLCPQIAAAVQYQASVASMSYVGPQVSAHEYAAPAAAAAVPALSHSSTAAAAAAAAATAGPMPMHLPAAVVAAAGLSKPPELYSGLPMSDQQAIPLPALTALLLGLSTHSSSSSSKSAASVTIPTCRPAAAPPTVTRPPVGPKTSTYSSAAAAIAAIAAAGLSSSPTAAAVADDGITPNRVLLPAQGSGQFSMPAMSVSNSSTSAAADTSSSLAATASGDGGMRSYEALVLAQSGVRGSDISAAVVPDALNNATSRTLLTVNNGMWPMASGTISTDLPITSSTLHVVPQDLAASHAEVSNIGLAVGGCGQQLPQQLSGWLSLEAAKWRLPNDLLSEGDLTFFTQ